MLDLVREQVHTHRDAFYVVDLAEVARKHAEWSAALPRVRPFYAVKCNDDPQIVRTLAALGTGFDCASKTEISMVLSTGVKPEDVIFAHPAKQVGPPHAHWLGSHGMMSAAPSTRVVRLRAWCTHMAHKPLTYYRPCRSISPPAASAALAPALRR